MYDETVLNDMDLPRENPKEAIETISRNFFKPLFAVEKFEVRSEHYRDKGIDFHIEIKKANKYTNFRFAVQLKATERENVNLDDSVSVQLYTSNINYLLNSGMPAFYVLYLKKKNIFLFENLSELVKSLYKKDPDWQKQSSHVLRFNKALDARAIEDMYDTTLSRGLFLREIHEKLAIQTSSLNSGDKILFDANLNVSDDVEIRSLIEAIGLEIINEGKWKEIIYVHKKASGNVAATAKYNLVLGVANYYSGNLIDALSFLKTAVKFKNQLAEDLQNHLLFFETVVKYTIGIISDDEYYQTMKALEKADNVGLYIRLENAKRKYAASFAPGKYNEYVKEVMEIINDPKANMGIQLNAKCELILFEGLKNNMDYIEGVAMMNALESEAGVSLQLRTKMMQDFVRANQSWYKKVQDLQEAAIYSKNYFVYFNAAVNEVKVIYDLIVSTDLVHLEQDIPGSAEQKTFDKNAQLEENLEKLTNAYNYYHQIGHIENTIATLYTKYEILHYLNKAEDAHEIFSELEELVVTYDLVEQKRKLEVLNNGGTTHERLKNWLDKILEEADNTRTEYNEMIADMKRMDEQERQNKSAIKNSYQIHLFPIGYFQFPKEAEHQVYEILNIEENTKTIFEQMFQQEIIPVANIYKSPITVEGFEEGKLADKGIDSWKNIYRIRKSFFEKRFYRKENIQ